MILKKIDQHCQDWKQDIVADLSAAVLCRLVGKKAENLGQHYRHIEKYAEKARKAVPQAFMEFFSDVENLLGLILRGGPAELEGIAKTG